MDVLIRQRFGLSPGPRDDVETADAVRTKALVRAAAQGGLLVSIAGRRGAGKTRAVRMALASLSARVVEPLRLDRERLHLGDVQDAIVAQLSEERPRRSGEARSGQVRRILGRSRGPVLLWIDDAHVIHPSTLRGLKRLLELTWQGAGPLLGIVLTGQRDRTEGAPEVGLRASRLHLEGLLPTEAARAIGAELGEAVEGAAATILASSARARNWLDLGGLLDECLLAAASRGDRTVTVEVAAQVLGGTLPTTPPRDDRPAGDPPPGDLEVGEFLRRSAA